MPEGIAAGGRRAGRMKREVVQDDVTCVVRNECDQ